MSPTALVCVCLIALFVTGCTSDAVVSYEDSHSNAMWVNESTKFNPVIHFVPSNPTFITLTAPDGTTAQMPMRELHHHRAHAISTMRGKLDLEANGAGATWSNSTVTFQSAHPLHSIKGRVALGENGKATLHVRALVSMKESSGCSGNQIQVHFYSGECSVPWGDGPDGQTSTGSACLGSATAGTSSQAWEKAVPGQGDRKGNKVKCEIRRSGSKLEGKLQGRCSASTGWSNAQADLGNYYYTVPSGNWENTGEHRRRTSSNMRRRTYPIGDQVKKCYNKCGQPNYVNWNGGTTDFKSLKNTFDEDRFMTGGGCQGGCHNCCNACLGNARVALGKLFDCSRL